MPRVPPPPGSAAVSGLYGCVMMLNLAMRFIFRSYSRVKKKNTLLRGNSTVEFTNNLCRDRSKC